MFKCDNAYKVFKPWIRWFLLLYYSQLQARGKLGQGWMGYLCKKFKKWKNVALSPIIDFFLMVKLFQE